LLGSGVYVLFQKYYSVDQSLGTNIEDGTKHPNVVAKEEVSLQTIQRLSAGRVMVAVAFGQSNSANFGETCRLAGRGVYTFHQGKLHQARDPLPGAHGTGGSVWTRLGDKLIAAKRYEAVVFVSLGVGATEIAQWQPEGDLLPQVLKGLRDLKDHGLTPTHLFWHQGEADGQLQTNTETYKARFLKMLSAIRRQGVQTPIYVCRASRCGEQKPVAAIRQAQSELVNAALNILPGPDTDALGDAYRYDGCHFSDEGLEKFADMWMEKLR
jgi:hypothetical protein